MTYISAVVREGIRTLIDNFYEYVYDCHSYSKIRKQSRNVYISYKVFIVNTHLIKN